MSTIAVNAITDANGGATTTINSVTPNANNVVGKNLIINGAMQIAQRGTSTTGVTTNGYLACDRFFFYTDTMGTWTGEQSTDAPDEFSNSFKISCTTADASPAVGDRVLIQHRIEGQFLQHLAKGTTSAKKVTLSFWIKSNKTGNMQVNLYDNDNDRFVSGTVTVNASATWEKKTITFVGDTSGALDNDNNLSLMIEWWLDSGTTWSSGTSPTTWQSNSAADRNANGTLALADSTSNYINITGVQLEAGSSATEFEHRPYGTELSLCYRYYEAVGDIVGGTTQQTLFADNYSAGAGQTTAQFNWFYRQEKRATPTIAIYGTLVTSNVSGSVGALNPTSRNCCLYGSPSAAGRVYWFNSAGSGFSANAEL